MKTKVTREGKKLEAPVTLFAAIEAEDHEFLRSLAFRERRSLADIVREAIHDYREVAAVRPAEDLRGDQVLVLRGGHSRTKAFATPCSRRTTNSSSRSDL